MGENAEGIAALEYVNRVMRGTEFREEKCQEAAEKSASYTPVRLG